MSNENLAPRDAKIISIILRSLGVEECEPKVIVQLLEFAYKYSCDVLEDAHLYAKYCERQEIIVKDVKLALQTKVGKHFVPPPPKSFLLATAEQLNAKPLSQPDSENLIRAPNLKSGMFSMEYIPDDKDSIAKKRKVY
ncbi:Transcription initiation factor TFIID subunit 9 [Glugoides intestinalis]